MRISDWSSDVCSSDLAHADAPDEQAIFEPGVGETPVWGEMVLTALYAADTPPALLLHDLSAADDGLDWSRAQFREEMGRASGRAGGCRYVAISVVAGAYTNNKDNKATTRKNQQ